MLCSLVLLCPSLSAHLGHPGSFNESHGGHSPACHLRSFSGRPASLPQRIDIGSPRVPTLHQRASCCATFSATESPRMLVLMSICLGVLEAQVHAAASTLVCSMASDEPWTAF